MSRNLCGGRKERHRMPKPCRGKTSRTIPLGNCVKLYIFGFIYKSDYIIMKSSQPYPRNRIEELILRKLFKMLLFLKYFKYQSTFILGVKMSAANNSHKILFLVLVSVHYNSKFDLGIRQRCPTLKSRR